MLGLAAAIGQRREELATTLGRFNQRRELGLRALRSSTTSSRKSRSAICISFRYVESSILSLR